MKLTRKKIALLMMATMILAIFLTGCQQGGGAAKDQDIIATVNEKPISSDLYIKNLEIFKRNYENIYGDKVWSLDVGGRTFLQAVQETVLEKLVTEEAIRQYMGEENITVDEALVEEQYQSYMENMKNQPDSQKFLEEKGIDENFIREQIRIELMAKRFREETIKELDLTDEKLEAYYKENIEEYRDIRVKASHILVEKEEEAKDLLGRIRAGEDFAELAKEYSQDPGSATQGGDLGYFERGMMVAPFDEMAFSLKEGEISEPVKTDYGYHIIKVVDHINELHQFEDVKEEIKEKLSEEEINSKIAGIMASYKIEKYMDRIKG
ncbi:MAG: peptidylprolyl isomerase [Thermotaleaceae bacterium]